MQFLDIVHRYKNEIDKIKKELGESPERWPHFQENVNTILTVVFQLCAQYEKENRDKPSNIERMKQLFIDQFREYFKIGKYTRWVVEKPLGYAGDYQIIEWIYQNKSDSTGIERCSDNYFLQTGAAIATRNRKEDFKKIIQEEICRGKKRTVKIFNLGSGPCRDIFEIYQTTADVLLETTCIERDPNAIQHARNLLESIDQEHRTEWVQKNIIKMALTKDIRQMFPKRFDIIFSTGLFDYLNHKIAVRLVRNLKDLMTDDGVLIISNYRERLDNPSRFYMEWGGDWSLIYRSEAEFLKIFHEAGFQPSKIKLRFEQQKIMQYCLARQN